MSDPTLAEALAAFGYSYTKDDRCGLYQNAIVDADGKVVGRFTADQSWTWLRHRERALAYLGKLSPMWRHRLMAEADAGFRCRCAASPKRALDGLAERHAKHMLRRFPDVPFEVLRSVVSFYGGVALPEAEAA